MDCSSCGFENPEGSRFCEECGTPLALRCPGCDAELRAGQRFCGACGTALTGAAPTPAAPAPAPAAVRKTVTVLFADLGGSTGFGERNDAEISRQVLARYHALLQETIDAHAGTVAKFMGDGMMATWGIPEVAEDDARRAVAAGTTLQQRFEDFAADVEQRHGETMALRVGINTGEVVIGEGDADLIGDALNVAARLEKACRPGHVLVGEETWRLTRSDFGYEALGEVTVAGRAQPVAIYEVAAEAVAAPEVAAPFVGRDAEMQRLVGVFDDARQSGTARLTTVLGSPGVGKTRLSRELCARLAEHGDAQSVELRCDRAGEATFAPVAQLIRDASGLTDDLDADAARAAIGALLTEDESDHTRVVDVLAGLVGVGPSRSVEETFWGVRRLVEATAATRPLVVVIDDIQWAEPLLLDLIEHLAEWVADAAVLVVGLARPELREVRPSLAEPGRPVSAVVVLDGLDASATEALAAGLLGAERLPAGLVERLPASTDGNPLFVRELVRMLVDDRVIRRRDDGEWELTIDADAVDVPPTIQSLLGARVERLPAAERELLEHASVVGAEFSLGALRELAGDSVAIPSLLEAMRRKELVEPTGTYWGDEPVHRFHHVLIRDAAYRRLLKTTRAELHERVAVWTDRTAADLVGEHEAATAFHYEQAFRYRTELGTVDDETARLGRRAAELLATAAQRALGRDDLASAGALSARALALLPESDAAARADLLQTACECLLASGDGAAAAPLVEELGRGAAGDARLAAWAECYAAQLVALTDPEGLVAADGQAQAAAEALTELGDGSGQAKAHQVRAMLLARLGRVGDAELELDLALAAARAADDRRRVTAVLGAAPDAALFGPSPVARAGGRCLDVVRLLRITTASPAVEAASNRCQAVLESLRGRFDVSRSMLATARTALEELGLRHGIAQTELYAGMVEMIAGDPHAAIPPLRAAFDGLGALGVGADAGNAAALLARALLVDGQADEADELATASEQLAGQNLKTAIGWRVARAEVLAARSDLAGAVALAEQAVEIAAGTDLVIDHADACVALAALRAQAGDTAGSRAARADAKRLYDQKGATVPAERLDAVDLAVSEPVTPASEPAVEARSSSPANAASDLFGRIAALFAAGRFDECGALCAEDIRIDDLRPVVGTEMIGRAAVVANFEATAALGSGSATFEPIAVRGSTLALGRGVMEFGDWGSSFLMLGELGPDGLGARSAWFDEADVVAAQAELDAWYLAGEGAEQAGAIRPVVAFLAAFHARDWEAFAEVVRGCEVVDHRGLWPGTGSDGFVERVQSLVENVPDATIVARQLHVRGDAALLTGAVRGAAAQGDRYEYSMLTIVAPGRIEHFDEHDLTAATARLEELGRIEPDRPGTVTISNAASVVAERFVELFGAGRVEECGRMYAEDARTHDRRSVTGADLVGRSAHVANLEAMAALGSGTTQYETVAIRGSSLVLGQLTMVGDWENRILVVTELGPDGLTTRDAWFDDGDLAAALELLDEWYIAGEGAEHAEAIASTAAWYRAMNAHDGDAMRELCAPDLVFVDQRQLGTPPLDRDRFHEWMDGYRDVGFGMVAADVRVRGQVQLVTAVNRAVDADGGEILWSFCTVSVADARGRVVRTEAFAGEDRAAALARFETLSRGDAATPIENTASRLHRRVVDAIESGDDESLRALVSTDFHIDDRRAVVNFGVIGYDESAAQVAWLRDEGYGIASIEDLAVRGERLALSRNLTRTPAGEVPLLLVIEVDDRGRLVAQVQMDDDDLDAAFVELDERYLAGEGAEHAQVLGAAAALGGGSTVVDSEQATPGFVFVDHRPLGWGTLDRDRYAAHWRAYADVRHVIHALAVRVQGRVALMTIEDRAVDPDGNEIAWVLHVLTAVAPDGRAERQEWFAELDWDAALARFEELSAADPRNPRVENGSTRANARWFPLTFAGRFDDARALLVPDYFLEDRRRTVSVEPVADRDAAIDFMRASVDVGFVGVTIEPIAVRGECLSLNRMVMRAHGGDEVPFLFLTGHTPDGVGVFSLAFDEADLDAALAELDDRHLAGEGAGRADLLRVVDALSRRHAARDWDGIRDLIAEDTTLVDHRRLGWPSGGRDVVVQMFQELVEMVTDHRLLFRKQHVVGRAVLTTLDSLGTTRDGSAYEWALHSLSTVDTTGRITAFELFAADDWGAALARLDELGAASVDSRNPSVENAATAVSARFVELTQQRRFDDAGRLLHPDLVRIDHRSHLAYPPIRGAAEYMAWHSQVYEQFDSIDSEPLAVRGERLGISLTSLRASGGFESVFLMLGELDDRGRLASLAIYDEDDLRGALDELEARYVVGEGAEEAFTIRRAGDFIRSLASLDGAATLALFHPRLRWADHRMLGFGVADLDGARSYLSARAEQISEDRSYFRDLTVRGSTMMGRLWSEGVGPDGSEALFEFHMVVRWVAGRMLDVDWYDVEDVDVARARFDDLAAAPPAAELDNACVGALQRAEWLAAFGSLEDAIDLIAPGVVATDHRSTVGREFRITGRDAFVANQIETRSGLGFTSVRTEWLVVRGERLALAERTWTTDGGFEVVQLATFELDEARRLVRNDQYDSDDLATAVAALDERYTEHEGAEHAERLRFVSRGLATIAEGDDQAFERWRSLVAPGFTFVDHRHAGWGPLDVDGLIEMQRSFGDVQQSMLLRRIRLGDRAALSTVVNRGVDPDGGEAEWRMHAVHGWDAADWLASIELFDDEAWDAAVQRFDELSGSSPSDDNRTLDLENTATRSARLTWRLLAERRFDELPPLAPGFSLKSQRRLLRLPEELDWLDGLMLLIEQYSSFQVEPLAVRGRRAAVVRIVAGDESGNESPWIATLQLDESDRWMRLVNFDEEHEIAAIDLLDEWYIQGEGAADAQVLTTHREGMRRYHAHDWDGIRAMGAADFEFVDHRPLPWPTSDADGLLRLMQERVEQVPDVQSRTRKLFPSARVVLSVGDVVGTDEHGGRQQWPVLTVYEVDTAGSNRRIEYFALEQWEAALARFDELAAEPASDPRHPRAENAATRTSVEVRRLVEENRLDEAEQYFADGYVRIDRRSGVTAPDAYGGRAFLEAWRGFYDVGLSRQHDEYLAVRGERFHLIRSRFETPDGDEVVFLQVAEVDEAGLAIAGVNFDADDLVGALEELDARYVASGVATDVEAKLLAGAAALNRRDHDAVAAQLSPDFVSIDHQPLGFPPVGPEEFLNDQMAGLDAMVPDNVRVVTKLLSAGHAGLMVIRVIGETNDGSRYEWTPIFVSHIGADGLVDRNEAFPPEDWDAALARFDELAAAATPDPRHARAENAMTRLNDRYFALIEAGRTDEGHALVAPDYVREDRRTVVALPDASGDEIHGAIDAARDVGFTSFRVTPIAVRGDRLTLGRGVMTTADGFEVRLLVVDELGADGRAIASVYFDEDALVDALGELDARYLAGEGAGEDVPALAVAGRTGFNVRDWETFRDRHCPDLRVVDRRTIGWPVMEGRDPYVGMMREYAEAHDVIGVTRKFFAAGSAALIVTDSIARAPDATAEWETYVVAQLARDGRVQTIELCSDWDAAFARFDELAASAPDEPAAEPTLENAALRCFTEMLELANARDADGLRAWTTPEFTVEDRRSVVAGPTTAGEEFVTSMLDGGEIFDSVVTDEVVAIRGDRLLLTRTRWVQHDGFDVPLLAVSECGGDGRPLGIVTFDPDDLAGAFQELEDRYVAGEGAADAYVIRRLGDLVRARTRRDWDAFRDAIDPELQLTDHRMLPLPTAGRDGFLAQQRSLVEVVADVTAEFRTLEVLGDTAMSSFVQRGASADGSFVSWELWAVWRLVAGRFAVFDFFDITDEVSSRARFEELAAIDPRTPVLDNECLRVFRRHVWLLARTGDDVSLVAGYDLLAPDLVQVDRRPGVAAPDLVGRDVRVQNLAAVAATFGDLQIDDIAVRGERLALVHWTITADGGFYVTGYDLTEIGADGRICRIVTFDDSQLGEAVEEMEARHRELSGDTYTPVERAFADGVIAANRGDFEAVTVSHVAGYEQIDHAPLGMGGTDSSGLVEHHRALHDQVDLVLCPARIFAAGRVGLAYLPYRGTTEDGGEYVWELAVVKVLDEAGLVVEDHTFLVEQWDEARALFDEHAAANASSSPVLENVATQNLTRVRSALLDGDLGAIRSLARPDVAYVDHRWGGVAPAATGPDEFLDHVRSAVAAGFVSDSFEVLAVRGALHALSRWTNVSASGDEVLHLLVNEVDADGIGTRTEVFEAGDLARAVELLDRWYLEGEGAEQGRYVPEATDASPAPENRATIAGRRAREAAARGDRAAMLDAFAPDFTRTEHRPRAISGDRLVGRELYVDGMLAGPDAGLTDFDATTLEIAGDDHGLGQVRWHNGDDFAQEWLLVYESGADSRLRRIANFEPEDRAAASALMHLWVSERGLVGDAPQNAVTRRLAAYPERFFAGDWPWIADLLAEGIVNDDRRTGVSAGVVTGRDAVLELTRALADVGFTSMTNDPIATGGDSFALFRRVWRHPDGYEVPLLALMELDDSDRMVANVMWDVLDFDAAIAELDRRARRG